MTLVDDLIQSPASWQDPYPAYARLREEAAVTWSDVWGAWVASRYADVVAALRDTRRFSNTDRFNNMIDRLPSEYSTELAPLREHFSLGVSNADPPDHTRLRALANPAFHPRSMAKVRPRVQAIVDELLDAAADAGEMDVVADLAFPLPAIVIAEMLGVPPGDRTQFRQWMAETVIHSSPSDSVDVSLQRARRAAAAIVSLTDWLRPMIESRRRRPTDDLLSTLVAAEGSSGALTEAELVTMCIILVRAGHQTTEALISNAVLALLQHPDQLALLLHRPELVPAAVEEFLRYHTSFLRTLRRVVEDTELGGVNLRAGDLVFLMLGSANHDPDQFPHSEQFDIARPAARHMSFGHGVHFCLGAPLARLEAELAITSLLARWPRFSLASTPPRHAPDDLMHHLESLRIRLNS